MSSAGVVLLYLLCGDPIELSAVLAEMQPPDIAEALRELDPTAAAKVLAALPFDARRISR